MADRICSRCGEADVRREHRAPWMKTMAYVIPIRPQICANCDASSWSLLQPGDGIAPWISSLTIWGAALLVLWMLLNGPRDAAAPAGVADPAPAIETPVSSAEPLAAPAPDEASAAPGIEPSASPAAEPEPAPTEAPQATAAPTATPTAEPTAKPTPAPSAAPAAAKAAKGRLKLASVDAAIKGDAVEIVLESDAANLKYTVTKSRFIKGYVIDLPGIWTVSRGVAASRDFGQTNLKQLRIGQHDKFLRVVLEVRDNSGAPPKVERRGGQLRIEVR
ncbi:MAG TPA: hypothetical protein VGE51_06360 [Fontimonas sp.]